MQKFFEQNSEKLFIGFINIPKQQFKVNFFMATSEHFSENEGSDFGIPLKLRP